MGVFTERLMELADAKYRDFMAGILPTVDRRTIIGVRAPVMKRLVREVRGTPEAEAFMRELPHAYYDENGLHAWLITEEKDFAACIGRLNVFLPYVDNWGVCDAMMPPVFKKHTAELKPLACAWARSDQPYVCRYGLGVLMCFFLDEAFAPEFPELAASVRSDEYYVKMMVAWYFATALAKQYEAALPFLTEHRLERWTHNKTIQKAVESRRIAPETKAFLKTLRIPR